MLAGQVEDINTLHYPVLATPKLDGIRCLVINGKALTRSFKPIPNRFVCDLVSKNCPDGFDGELIVPDVQFNETSSSIMSRDGEPGFIYAVFDYYTRDMPYNERMTNLRHIEVAPFVKKIIPVHIDTPAELLKYEKKCLDEGYEGVMIRAPKGPYKMGRATTKSEWLLKLKRFKQSEAKVIDIEEQMSNKNEIEENTLGKNYRRSGQDGMVPANTMGSLLVEDIDTGVQFSIGTGFDLKTRDEIWRNKSKYIGKLVTYTFQEVGTLNKPRFPTFVGFRDRRDM